MLPVGPLRSFVRKTSSKREDRATSRPIVGRKAICVFILFYITVSAVQFNDQDSSRAVTDYEYDGDAGPEGRHIHGALLKKKKKIKHEYKKKKKVVLNCLLNKLRKRSVDENQQKEAWESEVRVKRGAASPQGRFFIPIPLAVQYTNVQTGGGGYGGGGSSAAAAAGDEYGDGGDECGDSNERYANRFVGPYQSNDVYRQLYKNFMRWIF